MMNSFIKKLSVLLVLVCFLFSWVSGEEFQISNDRYTIVVSDTDYSFTLTENKSGSEKVFLPSLLIRNNPYKKYLTLEKVKTSLDDISYKVCAWDKNRDLYSLDYESIYADSCYQDSVINFTYKTGEAYNLMATLKLPIGDKEPVFKFKLNAHEAGYYTVGFDGSPKTELNDLEELFQPMAWTEKRFPGSSYLTPSFLCSMPASFARTGNVSYGIVVDPSSFPFDPLPTFARSEFGVAVRNNQNQAQPLAFAPIFGSDQSKLSAGESYEFSLRLFVAEGDINNAYEQAARRIYGFAEIQRTNGIGSMNSTINNMIDYAMSDWSRFIEELKGCSYQTDVPNSVKNVSALSPLAIAYITDDTLMYKKRALPLIEFFLSREKNNFSLVPAAGAGQTSGTTLGEPVMPSSEAAAIFNMTGRRMNFLLDIAEKKAPSYSSGTVSNWATKLNLYKATDNMDYWSQAMSGLNTYVNDRVNYYEESFEYKLTSKNSFWLQLAPKFMEIMEMYDATKNNIYLEAAREGARRYAKMIYMAPKVPDEKILVNEGNKAPVYHHSGGTTPISVPEEEVDAWRVSEIGLLSEAANTSAGGHRAIFMAHHAPYFLRIGALTGDQFLMDIARWAMQGRYQNFPGYHMNTDRTTVYEKPDYPLRPHSQLTANSFHYNHVYPLINLLIDFLVSEAYVRSDYQIEFPWEYVEGYAYLQNRAFNFEKGMFYGDSAYLWMPKNLLSSEEIDINYISARGDNSVYLAFMNATDEPISAQFQINQNIINNLGNTDVSLNLLNVGDGSSASLSGDVVNVSVGPLGITAVKLDGLKIESNIQSRLANNNANTWAVDYKFIDFTNTRAMYLNIGEDLSEIYVYSGATNGDYDEYIIDYKTSDDTDWNRLVDTEFPYEFEIPINQDVDYFQYKITTNLSDGSSENSEIFSLSKEAPKAAKIYGDDVILAGETAQIKFEFSGEAPWSIVYSDGVMEYAIDSIMTAKYIEKVSPSQSTSYTLVDFKSKGLQGTVSGRANVHVGEKQVNPYLDGMIREKYKDGQYSEEHIVIKDAPSWTREGIFCFDISEVESSFELVAFKMFLNYADKRGSVLFNIHGTDQLFDTTLTWINRPSDDIFVSAGDSISKSLSDLNTFFIWDVTDFINDKISNGISKFTFKVFADDYDNTEGLFRFTSTEGSSLFSPSLVFVDNLITSVDKEEIPNQYRLYQNYPNPFNAQTTIQYALKETGTVKIKIYDIRGNLVKNLVTAKQAQGLYKIIWDGRDMNGNMVSNGLYFYNLKIEDYNNTQKMILLK